MAPGGICKTNGHFYTGERKKLEKQLKGLASKLEALQVANAQLNSQQQNLSALCDQQSNLQTSLLLANSSVQHQPSRDADTDVDNRHKMACRMLGVTQLGSNSNFSSSSESMGSQERSGSSSVQSRNAEELEQQQQQEEINTRSSRLVAFASAEQRKRVMSMTVHDWCCYYSSTAAKLALLFEMLKRQDAVASGHQENVSTHSPGGNHSLGHGCNSYYNDSAATGAAAAQPSPPPSAATATAAASSVSSAEQEIIDVVADCCTLLLLDQVLNNAINSRGASVIDLATGRVVGSTVHDTAHWMHVAKSLHLSHLQMTHLSIAFGQYKRCKKKICETASQASRDLHAGTNELASHFRLKPGTPEHNNSTSTPNLAVQQQQNTVRGKHGGTAAKKKQRGAAAAESEATAVPEAAVPGASTEQSSEKVVSQLQGVLNGMTVAAQMMGHAIINTLSPLQFGRLIVSSYPFIPQPGPIGNAVHTLLCQQKELGTPPAANTSASKSALPKQQQAGDGAIKALRQQHMQQLQQRQAALQQQRQVFWQQRTELHSLLPQAQQQQQQQQQDAELLPQDLPTEQQQDMFVQAPRPGTQQELTGSQQHMQLQQVQQQQRFQFQQQQQLPPQPQCQQVQQSQQQQQLQQQQQQQHLQQHQSSSMSHFLQALQQQSTEELLSALRQPAQQQQQRRVASRQAHATPSVQSELVLPHTQQQLQHSPWPLVNHQRQQQQQQQCNSQQNNVQYTDALMQHAAGVFLAAL